MKKLILCSVILGAALSLNACGNMSRQDIGLLGGGIAGGAIVGAATNSTVGAVAGTIGGAYIGREIAKRYK